MRPGTQVDRPTLNPTLGVLRFGYPVSGFVDAFRSSVREDRDERPEVPQVPAPETVLVFRDPDTLLAMFYRPTDSLLFARKVAADGLDAGAASQASGLPIETVREILVRAAHIGLIVLPLQDGTLPRDELHRQHAPPHAM